MSIRKSPLARAALIVLIALIIAMPLANRVRAAEPPPVFKFSWGGLGSDNGRFNAIQGIGIDSQGNIYVADQQNNRIQKFTANGIYITQWASYLPLDIAVDANDIVFVTSLDHTIRKYHANGASLGVFAQFDDARSVAFDAAGNVYAINHFFGEVRKYAPDGTFIASWSASPFPVGIAVDASGNIYVTTDRGGGPILKFAPDGTQIATFNFHAYKIALSADGNLYGADPAGDRVQKFSTDGVLLSEWGTPGTEEGEFTNPAAIAVAPNGDVYVGELVSAPDNPRVQVFTYLRTRKIVVLFQGINSSLNCSEATGECQPGNPTSLSVINLNALRTTLVNSYGFEPKDILWYSYKGGTVDPTLPTGWRANSYVPKDTSKDYGEDILNLRNLIEKYGQAYPGTDFYLIGHSQGGFVAFQELGYLNNLPRLTHVKMIFTLDSPLGGSPRSHVSIAAIGPWGNPAANELVKVWNTASDSNAIGDTAMPVCAMDFIPPSERCTFSSNFEMVLARAGLGVFTYGNTNDPVYDPKLCAKWLRLRKNTTSQIVTNADSGADGLGTLEFTSNHNPKKCASINHAQIIAAKSGDITEMIGKQNLGTVLKHGLIP